MELLRRSAFPPLRILTRHFSNSSNFNQYLLRRRSQAEKSLLIQVSNVNSAAEIESHLASTFGPLSTLYLYSLPPKGKGPTVGPKGADVLWVLAEFEEKGALDNAVKVARVTEGALPFKSSATWFRSDSKNKSTSETTSRIPPVERLSLPKILPDFSKAKSLSNQMEILEESLKMTELGVRMRFIVAHQLEQAFATFFPHGCVLPFGSSVSGIGRQSGDLDLVLISDKEEVFPELRKTLPQDSKLWLQTKMSLNGDSSSARFQVQRVMETLADFLQLFLPGCYHVQRILQARVPILRFWSEFTDLQCDLSMTNSSGVFMSELLYIMTTIDKRFPTTLCSIRSWAATRKITNPFPGRQPTNFMLVLLLLHYLQRKKTLPTFDILYNNAGKEDFRVTSDGIDCTFLRNPQQVLSLFTPENQDLTSAELLFGFFEYYSEFDFASKGISLFAQGGKSGGNWGKPDSGPLYIQNPIERHLNVARNVSREEVVRFKSECCSALWKLETNHSKEKVSIKDLLLTPHQMDKHNDSNKIKMRDLLND